MNKKVLAALIVVAAIVAYATLRPEKDSPKSANATEEAAKAAVGEEVSPAEVASPTPSVAETNPAPTTPEPTPKPTQTPVAATTASEVSDVPTADDVYREEKIAEALRADKSLTKMADVSSVRCKDNKCVVELIEKDEGANAQMPMFDFIEAHPEYGSNFKIEADPDNPRITLFTISKEKL